MHKHITQQRKHPTEQKGAAATNHSKNCPKPQKYNFILHKNCSCKSTTQKLQNSNPKSAAATLSIPTRNFRNPTQIQICHQILIKL
jgi:hypothetical protein